MTNITETERAKITSVFHESSENGSVNTLRAAIKLKELGLQNAFTNLTKELDSKSELVLKTDDGEEIELTTNQIKKLATNLDKPYEDLWFALTPKSAQNQDASTKFEVYTNKFKSKLSDAIKSIATQNANYTDDGHLLRSALIKVALSKSIVDIIINILDQHKKGEEISGTHKALFVHIVSAPNIEILCSSEGNGFVDEFEIQENIVKFIHDFYSSDSSIFGGFTEEEATSIILENRAKESWQNEWRSDRSQQDFMSKQKAMLATIITNYKYDTTKPVVKATAARLLEQKDLSNINAAVIEVKDALIQEMISKNDFSVLESKLAHGGGAAFKEYVATKILTSYDVKKINITDFPLLEQAIIKVASTSENHYIKISHANNEKLLHDMAEVIVEKGTYQHLTSSTPELNKAVAQSMIDHHVEIDGLNIDSALSGCYEQLSHHD